MRLLLFLSGEHPTLPAAEALAAAEALGAGARVVHRDEQVLVCESDAQPEALAERLGMCHFVAEHLFSCGCSVREITARAEGLEAEFEGSFAVRVRRVGGRCRGLCTSELAAAIGRRLVSSRRRVNLESPQHLFVGIASGRFHFGILRAKVDRSSYRRRSPHLRPYFRPGSMKPALARAVVNLARVREGARFADPFCGSGGLLIEAGLLGARVYGFDVDARAVRGALENLRWCGLSGRVERADARELWRSYREYFHAIACDPPYGISASTGRSSLQKLYQEALTSIHRMLMKGAYACVLSPERVELESLAEEAGFSVEEMHSERVHASLVRRIAVLRK